MGKGKKEDWINTNFFFLSLFVSLVFFGVIIFTLLIPWLAQGEGDILKNNYPSLEYHSDDEEGRTVPLEKWRQRMKLKRKIFKSHCWKSEIKREFAVWNSEYCVDTDLPFEFMSYFLLFLLLFHGKHKYETF